MKTEIKKIFKSTIENLRSVTMFWPLEWKFVLWNMIAIYSMKLKNKEAQ